MYTVHTFDRLEQTGSVYMLMEGFPVCLILSSVLEAQEEGYVLI